MKKIKIILGSLAVIAMMATVACNKDEEIAPDPADKTYDAVVTTDLTFTDGPLTKITFPTNPTPSAADVILEYSDAVDGAITEARIYFDVRETPEYVKGNKVKGEDESSFTQSGVTMSLANIDAEDSDGNITGNTSTEGTKVTFYVRISTADNEWYYGSTDSVYVDTTPGGGSSDGSDDFKDDPSLWSDLTVQIKK
ncbi:MAG: hypothetical protein DRI84_01150 [Bacteroidetes bacterium]|nr:MAG: hypothetical protein DRI84_01150 [Bacteroidota bacterium]